jgi:SagB-type dehydrogenase family enzyme
MKIPGLTIAVIALLVSMPACTVQAQTVVQLPDPETSGTVSLEETLQSRRSVRSLDGDAMMSLEELSQVLWSAQGITSGRRLRTAPSAGALYPFTLYLVAERVESVDPGIYIYDPSSSTLELHSEGEFLADVSSASLNQRWITGASVVVALVADYSVITNVYGDRGVMYTHMEAGHISQNIYLQCESLGLGTCAVGAFDEDELDVILGVPGSDTTLYLMPVGVPD